MAGAALAPGALAEAARPPSGVGGRLVLPMNRNWRYHQKFVEGAHEKNFDDSGFQRVVTASTVHINGVNLGEYKGGYTPFSFDLTPHLDFDGDNVLAVDVDSTERPDIPPFGYQIDYLTFGGIYREVWLRIVPPIFIENIFAKPK